jgi:hypothetical protein
MLRPRARSRETRDAPTIDTCCSRIPKLSLKQVVFIGIHFQTGDLQGDHGTDGKSLRQGGAVFCVRTSEWLVYKVPDILIYLLCLEMMLHKFNNLRSDVITVSKNSDMLTTIN